ncbi:MAG: MarR family transcriptional regulator [Micrococcus sp.]|nr:MarR family transcriptional regulator [Micrococcus sp.]
MTRAPEPDHTTAAIPTRTGSVPSEVAWSRSSRAGHQESDVEMQAWRAYFEATALLQDRLEQHLKQETGLTLAAYNVLLLLNEAPDRRLRMGELASRMVFSPSRLTYQITTMEQRGWVQRRACSEDGRGSQALLTPEGRAVFRKAAAIHSRQVKDVFLAHLEGNDADDLLRVFSRLGRQLEQ